MATPANPKCPTLLNAEFIKVFMPFKNCGEGTLPLPNTALLGALEYTGLVYELLPLLLELW